MDRLTAIKTTDEIISKLTRKECSSIFSEANFDVSKLTNFIHTKYRELSGWYYDLNINLFCNEKIIKHIVRESIEMVAAETF